MPIHKVHRGQKMVLFLCIVWWTGNRSFAASFPLILEFLTFLSWDNKLAPDMVTGNQAAINTAFRPSGLSRHCLPLSPDSVQEDLGFSLNGTSPWSLGPSLVHPSNSFRAASKF